MCTAQRCQLLQIIFTAKTAWLAKLNEDQISMQNPENIKNRTSSYDSFETARDPVFIVGAHRSGTTLLHLMLNHHPEIAAPGEFDFLSAKMEGRTTPPTPAEYLELLAKDRRALTCVLSLKEDSSYDTLVRSFVAQLRSRNPDGILALVVHAGFEDLPRLWPAARFVHIVRDPRDVAASAMKMGWAGNTYTGVRPWLKAERSWDEVCALVPDENRHTIRFEDLISNPEATLTALCQWLGLSYSKCMEDYHQSSTYEPPNPAIVNQWQRSLSKEEIGFVEGAVAEKLQSRGYEPSGFPLIVPDGFAKSRLLLHDRIACVRFAIRRFGAVNVIGKAIARRFHLKRLELRLQLRMNEIEKLYLK